MQKSKRKKVFVAMSGGVDSSVAAALLKKQGHEVVGVHMRCYNVDGCAEADAEDVRRAAEVLGIPFYVFDFEKEYKKKVVEYMIDGYRRGLTPNPDVECNREIKFGLFLKKALEMGADYVATGHYVRIKRLPNPVPQPASLSQRFARLSSARDRRLLRSKTANHARAPAGVSDTGYWFALYQAVDGNKDQSYFLWTLTQEQLRYCLFPIGDYKKPEVRQLARRFGLLNAEKKDSQGICFLGKVQFADFLKGYIPEKRGAVLSTTGETIGEHRGAAFYTIGQRHIGVGNGEWKMEKGKDPKPLYVAGKDVRTNTLVVAEGGDNPALYRREVILRDANFIRPLSIIHLPLAVYTRVRYRQPLAKATLTSYKSSVISYKLLFARPQKAVAPGQSAVFYSAKGELLGGGVIVPV